MKQSLFWILGISAIVCLATAQAESPLPQENLFQSSLRAIRVQQGLLLVELSNPAEISVCSASGQRLLTLNSKNGLEAIPLQGLPYGFLYVTIRSGTQEMTQKVLFSGS